MTSSPRRSMRRFPFRYRDGGNYRTCRVGGAIVPRGLTGARLPLGAAPDDRLPPRSRSQHPQPAVAVWWPERGRRGLRTHLGRVLVVQDEVGQVRGEHLTHRVGERRAIARHRDLGIVNTQRGPHSLRHAPSPTPWTQACRCAMPSSWPGMPTPAPPSTTTATAATSTATAFTSSPPASRACEVLWQRVIPPQDGRVVR